ncbi:unnamed protein product [Nippostrongylus brasiliensis]|uniref:Uncharacterized protein n=1 Tax=Nippostrongylus brasiliensis TaxID=27835 RepID=A0A0N4Y831_NIPBR|nr:unnamed protein product [Nippostrongylus brasiliensis]
MLTANTLSKTHAFHDTRQDRPGTAINGIGCEDNFVRQDDLISKLEGELLQRKEMSWMHARNPSPLATGVAS